MLEHLMDGLDSRHTGPDHGLNLKMSRLRFCNKFDYERCTGERALDTHREMKKIRSRLWYGGCRITISHLNITKARITGDILQRWWKERQSRTRPAMTAGWLFRLCGRLKFHKKKAGLSSAVKRIKAELVRLWHRQHFPYRFMNVQGGGDYVSV